MSIARTSEAVLPANIKRTSRIVATVLAAAVVAAPLFLVLYAASGLAIDHPWLKALKVNPISLDPAARWAVFAMTLVGLAPILWGLDQVRRLFLGYAEGEVFTERAALRFRRFATGVLLTGIIAPVALTVLSLVLSALGTINPPSGVISVSSTDLVALLIGGVLRVISTVLLGAARIADENASFF